MPLVVKEIKRFESPHEKGEWFELQVPLGAGDLTLMENESTVAQWGVVLLSHVVKGWSYGVPVTTENIRLLDLDTFAWLRATVYAQTGIREEEEKKDSASNSPATTEPDGDDSPAPSST